MGIIIDKNIRLWFFDFNKFLEDNSATNIFDPDRILNGDKSGFLLCLKTGKMLTPQGYKNLFCVQSNNKKENITVLIMLTTSRKVCTPLDYKKMSLLSAY